MTIVARQPPARANGSAVNSLTFTLSELPEAGSLLTAQVFASSGVTAELVGGGVDSWVVGVNSVISGILLETFWGIVTLPPSETVEVEFSGEATYGELVVGEFTGGGDPDGPGGTSSGDTDEAIPPTLTLAGSGELVLISTIVGSPITGNTDNGFTDVFDPIGTYSTYSWQIVSGGSYSPETYTLEANDWYTQSAAFLVGSTPTIGIAGYPLIIGQSVKNASLY